MWRYIQQYACKYTFEQSVYNQVHVDDCILVTKLFRRLKMQNDNMLRTHFIHFPKYFRSINFISRAFI